MITFLLVTTTVLYSTQAFECGIHMNKNEELTMTINKCIRSNRTLDDIWDMTPMSSESDSSSSPEEDQTVNGKMLKNFRTRRATSINETNPAEQNTTDIPIQSNEEIVSENCIVQCIFQNMQMTDSEGYPIHAKILEGLLKNATSRELRDFLQDTTDDCFHEMDQENNLDACTYSTKLVTCLADRGKTNCSDWPVGDLPIRH